MVCTWVGKGVLFREASLSSGCPHRGVPLYHIVCASMCSECDVM